MITAPYSYNKMRDEMDELGPQPYNFEAEGDWKSRGNIMLR